MPHVSTIAAVATARGSGGIGIVRLSGPDSWAIAEQLSAGQPPLRDRTANLRRVCRPGTGEVLDQGIVLPMRGPHSYTGEDTVELQLHGSPLVLDSVMAACLELGAQPARPGEFTFRALLAGKLSLLQAEAVRDLVDAGSEEELCLARESLFADASRPFRTVLSLITRALASVEGSVDFPDQFTREDEASALQAATTLAAEAHTEIQRLLADAQATARLQRGVTVVIAGAPNVGKSSLMNALLKYPRVIVSDVPGTTRDSVAEEILLGRHRVTLVDTAGIGTTPADFLDHLAGEQARQSVERADIVLIVLDAETGLQPHERELLDRVRTIPHLVAMNKVDAGPVPGSLEAEVGEPVLGISATEGTELDALTQRLTRLVETTTATVAARQMVTRRQAAELTAADHALGEFVDSAGTAPADVLAYLLGEAREALQRLLGDHI
ncbi:MAG TPA: tRNA uridine-5-carboxymethylaminomethyl(34) synthesis GTPase MnmE, partial [Clostridia bacterium]|nr:tRNA uridine-5-carboxymethylaminomethyl(34) synthesis GTPase MnmE [Clostridia bacterium]